MDILLTLGPYRPLPSQGHPGGPIMTQGVGPSFSVLTSYILYHSYPTDDRRSLEIFLLFWNSTLARKIIKRCTNLFKTDSLTLRRKEVWRCLLTMVDVHRYIYSMHMHNIYIHHILTYLSIIYIKS